MLGIPAYLYRLVPANPILLRVVSVGGKRKKDLFEAAYKTKLEAAAKTL